METNLVEIGQLNQAKLKEFYQILNNSSISDNDKSALKFAIEFLSGNHISKLSSRSFLLKGDPGVGKTHLVEKFLDLFDIPIIFHGCAIVNHPKLINCSDLNEVVREMNINERFILFLDDLNYIFKYCEYDETSSGERKLFQDIIDTLKRSNKRAVLFVTSNDIFLTESILDRIEVKINVEIPSREGKLEFLKKNYSDTLKKSHLQFLTKQSTGYNFRDIPEVIKIAYRESKGKINGKNLNKAVRDYVPSSLHYHHTLNNIKIGLSDIIGKEKIKSELAKVIASFKKKALAKRLGLKRHNLLVFEGPCGTGKTFVVKALAGELKCPLISISAKDFMDSGPKRALSSMISYAKRFENSIIFLDEAEKIIGRHSMDEDAMYDGILNETFDGVNSATNAIIIFAVNNMGKFGLGFSDRFLSIRFELPNIKERREFCHNMLNKAQKMADMLLNYDEIARATEGKSFRDLEKMCNFALSSLLQGQEKFTTEELISTIRDTNNSIDISSIYG